MIAYFSVSEDKTLNTLIKELAHKIMYSLLKVPRTRPSSLVATESQSFSAMSAATFFPATVLQDRV